MVSTMLFGKGVPDWFHRLYRHHRAYLDHYAPPARLNDIPGQHR